MDRPSLVVVDVILRPLITCLYTSCTHCGYVVDTARTPTHHTERAATTESLFYSTPRHASSSPSSANIT